MRFGESPLPTFRYSFQGYDPVQHVRASRREVDVSPKAAREVCAAVKGRLLPEAKEYLEGVMKLKKPVAFRRYKKEGSHRASLQGFHTGGFPVKAANEVLQALKNLEANAEFKGFDPEHLSIIHAAAHGGRKVKAYTPRAFGRSSPSFNTMVHIEVVGKEV